MLSKNVGLVPAAVALWVQRESGLNAVKQELTMMYVRKIGKTSFPHTLPAKRHFAGIRAG